MKTTALVDKKACNRCGSEAHHLHHVDWNHKNNDPTNHEYLCTLCHAKEHGIEPRISELRYLLIHYNKAQKTRIALSNAVTGYSRIELLPPPELQAAVVVLEVFEKQKEKELKAYFKENPSKAHTWVTSIKGISDILAAKILAFIDFNIATTPQKLWAYAGLAPDSKKTKGKKANWNQDLKAYMYQLSDSFIKQRTPKYREIYDKEKQRQLDAGLKRGHADMRARRVMEKEFLRDLFVRAT